MIDPGTAASALDARLVVGIVVAEEFLQAGNGVMPVGQATHVIVAVAQLAVVRTTFEVDHADGTFENLRLRAAERKLVVMPVSRLGTPTRWMPSTMAQHTCHHRC